MKKNRLFNLVVLLAAVLFAQDSRAQTTLEGHTANPDSVALVALYNATNGPNWRDKTNWLSNQPLGEWEGVSTENVGHVYELRLERNRLSGEIPAELGNLANLRYLVLNQNRLSGAIPSELGNLASLRYLELDQNRLSGEIPAELGNLTNLERLVLSDNQLTGTIPKELGNLTNLTHLELDDNQLSTLPDSLFAGLSSLAVLRLDGNSVDPLPLTVSLEQVGTDQVKAVAPTGAPFDIVLPISVTNGSLSGGATTITIPVGSVESAPLTVVRTPGTTAAVTVDIGTLPGLPTDHAGYALAKASDLPLEVLSSTVGTGGDSGDPQPEQPQQPEAPGGEEGTPAITICDRTPQVRDAIVAAVSSVSDCNDVTETHLASEITSLFLNGQRITTLNADDFAGLTSLTDLSLYDNQLTTLPAGLFDGLTALTTLYLNGNQLTTLPDGLFAGLSSLATLYLYGNSVDPLPLTISLAQVGADQIKAVAPTGAPFDIVLPISVTNGRISNGATTITIPAGSVESQPLTVVGTPGTAAALTVDMGTLPGLPTNHAGYALAKASDLPLEVSSTLANTAPVFTDGARTTRTIAENTAANSRIGTAIAATDANNDALTYTLGGTDAAAFSIDSTSGQLKTRAALDYETKVVYTVTVSVSDGSLTDTITVTITVTDLDESPPVEPEEERVTPTLTASTAAPLTEATLDGSVVTLTLSDGPYVRSISDIRDAVLIYGIRGVSVDRITRVSDTKITVVLNFDGTDFDTDATLTCLVRANAIADYNKILTSRISVTATTESEEQPEQPAVVDRTTFESSTPADYTEVTLSKTGEVWGGPTQFTDDSDVGTVAFMALGKLKGCSFADAEVARSSKVYIKTQDLGQLDFASETVCGKTTSSYSSWQGFRITHLRFFDETTTPNILEAVYNPATGQMEIVTPHVVIPHLTASTAAPLTEVTLHGSTVTLTLSRGGPYASSGSQISNAVTVAGVQVVLVDRITRVSDTKITVALRFKGNMDTDATLTFTVGAEAIANYNGAPLTAQIPVIDTIPYTRFSMFDFNTLKAAGNTFPSGLWSDGTTMWVADYYDEKIYAYNLSTKARDAPTKISIP